MADIFLVLFSFSIFFCNILRSSVTAVSHTEMVKLSGGRFRMGTDSKDVKDGEGPSKMVKVKEFLIDKYPVTNENFRKFVREKKYKTDAEKYGWSFAFFSAVPEKTLSKIKQSVQGAPWWVPVNRAYWRQPQGPGTCPYNFDFYDNYIGLMLTSEPHLKIPEKCLFLSMFEDWKNMGRHPRAGSSYDLVCCGPGDGSSRDAGGSKPYGHKRPCKVQDSHYTVYATMGDRHATASKIVIRNN